MVDLFAGFVKGGVLPLRVYGKEGKFAGRGSCCLREGRCGGDGDEYRLRGSLIVEVGHALQVFVAMEEERAWVASDNNIRRKRDGLEMCMKIPLQQVATAVKGRRARTKHGR